MMEGHLQEKVMENLYKDLMKFLSSPKNPEHNPMEESREEIYFELKNGAVFKRDLWAKIAARENKNGDIELAINSTLFLVSPETYEKIRSYFLNSPDLVYRLSRTDLNNSELVETMMTLIIEGAFYFV